MSVWDQVLTQCSGELYRTVPTAGASLLCKSCFFAYATHTQSRQRPPWTEAETVFKVGTPRRFYTSNLKQNTYTEAKIIYIIKE